MSDVARLTVPVGPADHVRGRVDAPRTLVEYGDYECPHCAHAHPVVERVRQRLGDRLRFVFRNFPLSELHPHALHAALAAEAAGAQGEAAFWAMHDRLLTHRHALDDASLVAHARHLGLDAARVADALHDDRYGARVRADFLGGVRSGVNGTPTFFIDGVRFDAPWDEDTLVAALTTPAPLRDAIDVGPPR